jgi:hypothetical protein
MIPFFLFNHARAHTPHTYTHTVWDLFSMMSFFLLVRRRAIAAMATVSHPYSRINAGSERWPEQHAPPVQSDPEVGFAERAEPAS